MAKIIKWAIFSVVIALLPLLFNYLSLLTKGKTPSFELICQKGELLLICVAISAAAIGELIGSGKVWNIPKLISGGGCIAVLIFSCLWYADISTTIQINIQYNATIVLVGSLIIFGINLIFSSFCIYLSDSAKPDKDDSESAKTDKDDK